MTVDKSASIRASAPPQDVVGALESIMALPAGWNSHAAAPVSRAAAARLVEIARDVLSDEMPLPHVVPLSSGGVQIEWHERDMDIEVAVESDGSATVWFEDARNRTEAESELSSGSDELRNVLAELTRRA